MSGADIQVCLAEFQSGSIVDIHSLTNIQGGACRLGVRTDAAQRQAFAADMNAAMAWYLLHPPCFYG